MYASKQQNISPAPGPLHVSLTKQINMKSFFGTIREQCHPGGRVCQNKKTLTCAQKRVHSAASTAGAPSVSSINENSVLDAVIVGAGISGLTTALVCCDMLKVIWIG